MYVNLPGRLDFHVKRDKIGAGCKVDGWYYSFYYYSLCLIYFVSFLGPHFNIGNITVFPFSLRHYSRKVLFIIVPSVDLNY